MKHLIPAALLFTSGTAFGFGAAGHKVVCEIAWLELTPSTRAAVEGLMARERNPEFKSFAKACLWADAPEQKRGPRRTGHYINVPRGTRTIRHDRCVVNRPCLFSAIRDDIRVLRSKAAPERRWEALKYLGHWMADLHQPLHVSFADDRGANDVLLERGSGCPNLHAYWDSCLPESAMRARGFDPADRRGTGKFARLLHGSVTGSERARWAVPFRAEVVADESFGIARQKAFLYCTDRKNSCRWSPGSLKRRKVDSRTVKIPSSYAFGYGKVVTARLKAAGVRLGALLNDIFSTTSPEP